jgi:threonine dehydrogenase-like Zn-dependent dehydrogenase
MSTQIRFFGVAAYELITGQGQHILIDPFLDENPGSPIKSQDLNRVDLIIVSHAAIDHLGDTEAIARRTRAPVIYGGEFEQTNQEGAPVVIEATGNPGVMESTAHLVAAGGRIVVVGLVAKGVQVQFPGLDFTRKEMTILGSRTETNCFPEALELLARGKIRYPKFATAFDLWSAPAVFGDIARTPDSVHKGVFVRN